MNIVGIGDERKAAVDQIKHLVSSVKAFTIVQFKSLLQSYEAQDATMYQILSGAVSSADSNYSRFLNGKIFGVSPRYALLVRNGESIDSDGALADAMKSLRESLHDEMEYRREFLAPEISKACESMDRHLIKVQTQENKRQKLEARAKSKRAFLSFLSR